MAQRTFPPRPKLAPSRVVETDILQAHAHAGDHRDDLLRSERCGCFYCQAIFSSAAIEEWIGEETALCPMCGIDSVIGSASGYPIETGFLQRMADHWFRAVKKRPPASSSGRGGA